MSSSYRQRSTVQLHWEHRTIPKQFQSGVSLHSHTMHSEESLDVLHIGEIPILSRALLRHIDWRQAFWTPPLSPRQAYRVEEKQIQRQLQLPALVSLTDHDDIRAGTALRVMEQYRNVPISVEWTVPFGCTFFHIGVHNLPAAHAHEIVRDLQAFTAHPDTRSLREKLFYLNSHPNVLLVLNHPLWDEKGIGSGRHAQELARLLSLTHPYLHALELNGLRNWSENRAVFRLGNETGKPVVAGGDRHGCEPNAILNLSAASTFPEFVEEVRHHGRSHVLFMQQYRQALNWRTMQTVIDVLRDYPSSFAGRRTWTKRMFCRLPDGSVECFASVFPQGKVPFMFEAVKAGVDLVQLRGVRSLVRMLISGCEADRRCSI